MSRSTTMPAPVAAPPVADPRREAAVVAAPVKVRRRPAFMIASVVSLLLGGLLGAFLWVAATTTVEVAPRTVESATVPTVDSGNTGNGPATVGVPRQVIQLPIPGIG